MREVNFSLPTANKASISITHALYDRRALDCTSTLPLIHSLNNLAYLTTSSNRIRDILTVDGGIERLVCILKEGRSKDPMEVWKWNLAFQCIVNIGVRGSEAVRTRVVEADMVPVIATILDNYFQVMDKCRERQDLENKRKCPLGSFGVSRSFSRSSSRTESSSQRSERSRRPAPPPISIPETIDQTERDEPASNTTPTGPAANLSLSSPPETTSFPRQHFHPEAHGRQYTSPTAGRGAMADQPRTALPSQTNIGAFGFRPVRDVDRLPSMVSTLHADLSSQPQSPATPHGPVARPGSPGPVGIRRPRRPSIRHQLSTSGSDEDGQVEEAGSEELNDEAEPQPEPHVDIQSDIVMQDIVDDDEDIIEQRGNAVNLGVSNEDETFGIAHRISTDGSATLPTPTPTQEQAGSVPAQLNAAMNILNQAPANAPPTPAWLQVPQLTQRGFVERSAGGDIAKVMRRDEDVLMSLQLLAYVSKYCNLRSYFQQSHLVPRLKIGKDLNLLEPDFDPTVPFGPTQEELDEDWDNEFVVKEGEDPYNIFPLIEKFTNKPSSSRHVPQPIHQHEPDMSYWAGVVMRNLCRKDDSRGGIRQCAYWQCGKWEEFTRQFAKCRRCRRTKYCSKECQKGAWASHRFWCVAAEDSREGEPGSSGDRSHRHHHPRSSHGHHHHHHADSAVSGLRSVA